MKSENNKNNMDIEDPKQDSSRRRQIVKDHKKVISILSCSVLLVIIIVAVVASLGNSNHPTDVVINGKVLKFNRTKVIGENAYKFIPHWIREEESDSIITFNIFLENIESDEDFLKDFISILKNGTDFDEYNFECPPTSRKTYEDNSNPFEFILMKSEGPKNDEVPTKPAECKNEIGVLKERIQGQEENSTLVFPCPETTLASATKYAHLSAFVQGDQEKAMEVFQETTDELYKNIDRGDTAKWYLSSRSFSSDKITNWVHLRIDPSPKYYQYNPYKTM